LGRLSLASHVIPVTLHHLLAAACRGTNYAMWVPFILSDANMAFRFALEVTQQPMQQPQEATVQQ